MMRQFDYHAVYEKIKESFSKKRFLDKGFKFAGRSILLGGCMLLVAILLIIGVRMIPAQYTKIDLTSEKMFSLSPETENVIKNLEKDITVFFLTQTGNIDTLTDNILEKYDGFSDKLSVKVVDLAANPNFAEKYTKETVHLNTLIIECEDKSKYLGIDDLYRETINGTTEFIGERSITGAISYVSGKDFPKIYFTTNHGEMPVNTTLSDFMDKSNIEYRTISIDVSGIPKDASVIVIHEPDSDISENEKILLEEYLENGGNLILYTGYSGVEFININMLMKKYGVTCENKLVVEGNASNYMEYAFWLLPEIISNPITDPIIEGNNKVITPDAKPIKVTEKNSDSVIISEILKTTDKAYTKESLETTIEKEAADVEGQYTIGAVITTKAENGESNIMWITSGQMLNEQVDSYSLGANHDLFLNAVNKFTGNDDGVAIRSKSRDYQYLQITSFASMFWSIIFVFVIPILIIVIGIYVWMKRRAR